MGNAATAGYKRPVAPRPKQLIAGSRRVKTSTLSMSDGAQNARHYSKLGIGARILDDTGSIRYRSRESGHRAQRGSYPR